MYGNDCTCELKCEFKCTCCQFKCTCGWNENVTLKEHKSFQDLRIVSKPRIYDQSYFSSLIVGRKIKSLIDPFQSKTRNTIQSKKIQWNQKSKLKFHYPTKNDGQNYQKTKIVIFSFKQIGLTNIKFYTIYSSISYMHFYNKK